MLNSAKFEHISASDRYRKMRRRVLRQFCRDEDGTILVMALLLLVIMLVLGGMAVDFMRFESRRALLQSVSDRAVLAAAELDQTLDSKAVVIDYFEKAGFAGAIVGEPVVSDTVGSRSVQVRSEIALDTFYLRFVGIDSLEAPAASGAIEGTGNIEISMVLDISGSMRSWVSSASEYKYILLREAATGFVDALLKPEYKDQISISLVSYTSHVNIGDELFSALNTAETMVNAATGETTTNTLRCVDFLPSEFGTTTFDTARTYQQVEMFDPYTSRYQITPKDGQCPTRSFEGIIPLTQNATLLNDAINQLSPTRTTAIHLGVKWGVSLLDPSMRDLLAGVPTVDPAFAGLRPSNYATADSALTTVKYLVVMTDGENVATQRLRPEHMDTFEEVQRWNSYNFKYWRYDLGGWGSSGDFTQTGYTAAQADNWMQSMCDAAKDQNITVFTIAMGATSHGEDEMRQCASTPQHYFETEGDALIDIFQSIADQITDLRLSL